MYPEEIFFLDIGERHHPVEQNLNMMGENECQNQITHPQEKQKMVITMPMATFSRKITFQNSFLMEKWPHLVQPETNSKNPGADLGLVNIVISQ